MAMIFLKQTAEPFAPVDPEWELRTNDYRTTPFSIQDARAYGGGFSVNEAEYDADGELTGMIFHCTCRTLAAAKAKALQLYAVRVKGERR
jgi:hypothetical protein